MEDCFSFIQQLMITSFRSSTFVVFFYICRMIFVRMYFDRMYFVRMYFVSGMITLDALDPLSISPSLRRVMQPCPLSISPSLRMVVEIAPLCRYPPHSGG